jgi:membrane-bound ClpP family serine protease
VGVSGVFAAITLGEVGQQIAQLVRNIALQILDILSPVLTTVGAILIVFGIIAFAAGREWIGLRLITIGGLLLIAMHLIVPMLLQFI